MSRFHILLRLSIFEQSIKKRISREKSWVKGIAWIFFTKLNHAYLEFVTQFCVTREFSLNTFQNKCMYRHSINPKYIKQWIIYHFKRYIWLGTFRYNRTRGQLINRGGGELHEMKRSRDKNGNRQRNSGIKSKQISFENTRAWDCFTTWKVICVFYLYWNVFQ